MVRCEKCFQMYDDNIAMGVCPHCGYFEGFEEEDLRYLPIGTILQGRYSIGGVIGAGGFGITYRAWDLQHNVCKAVKEYFQQGVANRIPGTTEVIISAPKKTEEFEYGRMRLLNEAQIIAKFQSKAIVKVDDYFEENNTSYMVMEYIETKTLEDYIVESKCVLEPQQAINMALNICEALDEIHKVGVIHRDISPDNIFIDDDGNVKIIDFGSARLSREIDDDRMIVLKPGFAPPEQYEKIDLSDDKQREWTDIYALGATLYMALTGVVPAESSDRKADFDNHTDRVCYPKEINPMIPEFLNNAIMKAMAINAHERFQNAKELAEVLRQEKDVLPVEVVRKRKKKRRTYGIGGGILAVVVLLAVFGFNIGKQREDVLLEAANISVWYSVDENNENAKNKAMQDILDDITSSNVFTRVKIEVEAIPEEEYEQRLEEAYQNDSMPTVFESVEKDVDCMEDTIELEDIIKEAGKNNCYYLKDYDKYFEDYKQVPTGFQIPVVYLNTVIVQDYTEEFTFDSMEDLMGLAEGEFRFMPTALKLEMKETYEKMYSDFNLYETKMDVTDEGKQTFLDGECAAYFSDTSDYMEVQSSLPGQYVMIPLGADEVICEFTNYWSVSECDKKEEKAGIEVVKTFLTDNAQDKFYLQNANSGLPIHKKTVNNYVSVRHKFETILSGCEEYIFEKE